MARPDSFLWFNLTIVMARPQNTTKHCFWWGQTIRLSNFMLQLFVLSSCEQWSKLCVPLMDSHTYLHGMFVLRAIHVAWGSWGISQICSSVHLLSWLCACPIKLNVLNALIVIQTLCIKRTFDSFYSYLGCTDSDSNII